MSLDMPGQLEKGCGGSSAFDSASVASGLNGDSPELLAWVMCEEPEHGKFQHALEH